jgi:hypothetical protein
MVSSKGGRFKSYKSFQYTGKDSNFMLLVSRYWESVQDDMKSILASEKEMNQKEVKEFMNKFVTINHKMLKDVKKKVAIYYSEGLTSKECAKKILEDYYDITKVNKYPPPMEHEEITEVTEKKGTTSFYHFKHVSESLFWNFINRVNKLDIKFIFDTSYINKLDNSLNNKNLLLYMETPEVNDKKIEYEFTYSKLLSNILKVINNNKYSEKGIKFFIAIDKVKQLRFGYVINEKRYTFGGFYYRSDVIFKLAPYVKIPSGDIDLKKLSIRFKSNLDKIWHYKNILEIYLNQYNNTTSEKDTMNIYVSVIDNKLALVIDSKGNDDVLNKRYIEHILDNNIKNYNLSPDDFYVDDIKFNGKTHYYIIMK